MPKFTIRVAQARNLPTKPPGLFSCCCGNGAHSSYCIVILNKVAQRTPVAEGTYRPRWEAVLHFDDPRLNPANDVVQIQMWTTGDSCGLLGKVDIPINDLVQGLVKEGWWLLDGTKIEVRLRLLAEDFGIQQGYVVQPPAFAQQWQGSGYFQPQPSQPNFAVANPMPYAPAPYMQNLPPQFPQQYSQGPPVWLQNSGSFSQPPPDFNASQSSSSMVFEKTAGQLKAENEV